MRITLGIAALAGLLLAIALVALEGLGAVLHVLASARWGILVAALLHLWPLMFCAGAWGALMPPPWRPSLPTLYLVSLGPRGGEQHAARRPGGWCGRPGAPVELSRRVGRPRRRERGGRHDAGGNDPLPVRPRRSGIVRNAGSGTERSLARRWTPHGLPGDYRIDRSPAFRIDQGPCGADRSASPAFRLEFSASGRG